MSKDYEKIKADYDNGSWKISRARFAVKSGWITKEEFEVITGKKYD